MSALSLCIRVPNKCCPGVLCSLSPALNPHPFQPQWPTHACPLWLAQEGKSFFELGAGDTAALRTGPALGIGNGCDQQTAGDESVDVLLCRVRPERSLPLAAYAPSCILSPGRPPPACCGSWGGEEAESLTPTSWLTIWSMISYNSPPPIILVFLGMAASHQPGPGTWRRGWLIDPRFLFLPRQGQGWGVGCRTHTGWQMGKGR